MLIVFLAIFFADDRQLRYSFKQHVHSALILLIGCLSAVKDWLAGFFFLLVK